MKNLIKENSQLKVALYARLSKDDGENGESNSITNQKALLKDYADNNLLNVVHMEYYVDDGYTGLNTNRPSFIKMIEDIKLGAINCVVVKDLSRFGRNSWEVGRYLEQIFPFLNVRFVAINDSLDSNSEKFSDNMLIPFKNMINEAYSRDISSKIRSQFEIKRKNGDFIGNFAPYGYKKSQENHNKLVIDEEVVYVIKDIFKWKIEGYNNLKIAEKLNDFGVLSPYEYKQHKGFNYDIAFKTYAKALWSSNAIGRILSNEVYIGNVVQGKKRTPNLKVKKFFNVPKDEWVRVEGTHDAIISKEDFNLVQELLNIDTKKSPNEDELFVFAGLLKCSDCGETMVRINTTDKGKKYYYYVCSSYKYKKECKSHRISEKKLFESIKEAINFEISYITNLENVFANIEKSTLKNISIVNLNKQLESLELEIQTYEKYKKGLIEVYSKNMVEEDFFINNMETYKKAIEEINIAILNVQEELLDIRDKDFEVNEILKTFKEYKGFKELTRKLVINIIDKIIIMENKEVYTIFKHSNKLDIYKEFDLGGVVNG